MRLPSPRAIAIATLAVAISAPVRPAAAQRQQAARPNDAINIPFEKYTLPNGLTVILSPDRSVPTVTVDVWYHVGSKNEVPGRTGFAHMFEHVMFTGSGNIPYGLHDRYTQGVGGGNNGSTAWDRTNYYETVPSNYLETALWLESDRMGFLLDALDSAKFAAQRDIVQNERRQGVENAPYGRMREILWAATYPVSNPYSWPIVGHLRDLKAASVDDVKDFFRLYYAPTNATIAIVGDFDPAQAKQWVSKYFGSLSRGKSIDRPEVAPPTLNAETRLVYEDRVQTPRLYLGWPTVGERHDDKYALDVMFEVLYGSRQARTSRLNKALVYDNQSVAFIQGAHWPAEDVGQLFLEFVPRPGNSLTMIEASVDSVLDRFKREGPTAEEIQRALAGLEFQFVSSLQSGLRKAETLLAGQVYHGDPGRYKADYTKMRAVTASDVKRVANTYLGKGRVVLSIVPEGKLDLAAKAEASAKVTVAPEGAGYIMSEQK